jgi:predicted pyridoxine 5'-phosphate oxidase superfamily flavin-nucleotide-binding protein
MNHSAHIPRRAPSDVAFTASVKALQTRAGSRRAYARMEEGAGWQTEVTPELAAFVAEQTSFFFATANAAGQPHIQHRGGPKGVLRVLDATTLTAGPSGKPGPRASLAFADYSGNRQYISLGNLAENPKVHLFLIDYATRRRIKIWGEARVVDDDPALIAALAPAGYDARPERAIVIQVVAWDENCPQHIPLRLEAADVAAALRERDLRIAELEAELAAALAAHGKALPAHG